MFTCCVRIASDGEDIANVVVRARHLGLLDLAKDEGYPPYSKSDRDLPMGQKRVPKKSYW